MKIFTEVIVFCGFLCYNIQLRQCILNRLTADFLPKRNSNLITGEIKNKVDRLGEMFWMGGIPNPLNVIEHITHLIKAGCVIWRGY